MRYQKVKRHWKTILRAQTTLNEGIVRKLEELKLEGNETLCSRVVHKARIQVFHPDVIEPGRVVDVLFEKRSDGMKRISFIPDDLVGLEMDLKHVLNHILDFMEACKGAKEEVINQVFND